jgi:hypothetical protein
VPPTRDLHEEEVDRQTGTGQQEHGDDDQQRPERTEVVRTWAAGNVVTAGRGGRGGGLGGHGGGEAGVGDKQRQRRRCVVDCEVVIVPEQGALVDAEVG